LIAMLVGCGGPLGADEQPGTDVNNGQGVDDNEGELGSPCRSFSARALTDTELQAGLQAALADEGVASLTATLQSQHGYSRAEQNASGTLLDCEGQTVTSIVIPFLGTGAERAAHIAFWDGRIKGVADRSAVAGREDSGEVLAFKGGAVRTLPRAVWEAEQRLPLNSLMTKPPQLVEADGVSIESQSTGDVQAFVSCKWVDAWRNGYTLLGFVAYRFHQKKYYCYNGSRVSNVTVNAYVSNMDSQHYYQGVVSSSGRWGTSYTSHVSMRQGRIDNCVLKYGCIGSDYPAVEITAYKSGSYTYRTWD
jgi:hypothetical protein